MTTSDPAADTRTVYPIAGRDDRARLRRAGVTDRQARLVLASGPMSRAERLALLQDGPESMGPVSRLEIDFHVRHFGPLPFVATIAGFVYLGAEVVGIGPGAHLTLADPGPWFEPFVDTRIRMGPGRLWHLEALRPCRTPVRTGTSW